MPRLPPAFWKHCLIIPALLACLPTISAQAANEPSQWLRVNHRSDLPVLQARDLRERLSDYGSFQWGRLERDQIERLRARGLSVDIEADPFRLTLGGQTFDPLDAAAPAGTRTADPEGDFHLVQFHGPIRTEWLHALRDTGVEIVQPLHPFSYVVWAPASRIRAAAGLPPVRWSGVMQVDWKVPPGQRFSEAGPAPTMALASAHVDPARLGAQLEAFGKVHDITRVNRHYLVVHLDMDRRDYPLIAELPAIYTVQYIRPETALRGEMSNQSIVGAIDGGGTIQPGYATWLDDSGYNGSGITVGVVDGRARTSHQDLAGRIAPCTGTNGSCASAPINNHGTHVAGAIAGTGVTGTRLGGFLRGQGVAPGASIVSQIYSPFTDSSSNGMVPDGMLKIYQDAVRSGALLTNNSWGPTSTPQGYNIPTRQIDVISRDADPDLAGHQPVLAVWSIMNGYGDSGGNCAPSSLGSPDEAKNLFAVGSTSLQSSSGSQSSSIFRVSSNSGHGPACDGRRVPHIVAPGCWTDSTSGSGNGAHYFECGTSMASPVVSGSIAVWAEKYIARTGANPSPALIKAVFTAAARDLAGESNADGATMGHRPDRFQGYGRIDLEAVMNHGVEVFMHDQEMVFDGTGQTWSRALNAVDPARPIRIMLAWTDAPGHGLGGAMPAWVNNLDLSVTAGGQSYLGNVIGADGWSTSGGTSDPMNNLEGVFLDPGQHGGAVSVTVTASNLTGDALNPYDPGDPAQDFALVCYNCMMGDPTYSMETTPDVLQTCIPESGGQSFDIDVVLGSLGGYSSTVSLTSSGEPAGVSSSLNPANVLVPGSSTWTINVAETAAAGTSTLSVAGDDGNDQHAAELSVRLDSLLAAPSPQLPAEGAEDLVLTPAFEWNALPDVGEYRIQIATDSAFAATVIDQTVAGASYVPASDLTIGTRYFWRVQGHNLCGGGAWSEARSFTTRLEPIADFSRNQFNFHIPQGDSEHDTLTLGNVGTGNLTFQIMTDQPAVAAGRGLYEPGRDEILQIGDFTLPGNETAGASAAGGVLTSGMAMGFTFKGTVSGIGGTYTYASDMIMTITSPDGTGYSLGGFNSGYPPWDFDGSGSSGDGTYTSTHVGPEIFGSEGTADEGLWNFDFEHSYNDTMHWADVSVTLHKAPPPYCGDDPLAAEWLEVSPTSGSIGAGSVASISISIDTAGLATGDYAAYLCVATNDPARSLVPIAIDLTVCSPIEDSVFEDRFILHTP